MSNNERTGMAINNKQNMTSNEGVPKNEKHELTKNEKNNRKDVV